MSCRDSCPFIQTTDFLDFIEVSVLLVQFILSMQTRVCALCAQSLDFIGPAAWHTF
jgi:hypothetical protein